MSELENNLAIQIRGLKLPPPEREFRFAPPRKWRFDFAWPDRMIALEVEGGTWVAGAHSRGKHFEADCRKYAEAAILGWRVIRVTTDMVKGGSAVDLLIRALQSCQRSAR